MRRVLLALTIVVGLAGSGHAQTLSSTALGSSIDSTTTTLTLVSTTGINPGFYLFIDRETMVVRTVVGSTVTVFRANGGLLGFHFSGALVYYGPPSSFQGSDVSSGSCNVVNSPIPYISIRSARVWVCSNLGDWVEIGPMFPLNTLLIGTGPSTAPAASNSVPVTNLQLSNGSAAIPSLQFVATPTSGLFASAGTPHISVAGVDTYSFGASSFQTNTGIVTNGDIRIPILQSFSWSSSTLLRVPGGTNGILKISNNGETVGSTIKVDSLPTVGSGFGTSPSVTAGSTAFAGSVGVGTGGVATSGVITFGGTAFPSAPFCTYSTQTTNAVTRGVPTTTQITLSSTTAWVASDIVSWVCVSSR